MAESMNDVKHRIASTKSTRQITEAMQMVSTVKLNRIQAHTVNYNQYVSKVKSVIAHLAQSDLLEDNKPSSQDSKNAKKKTAYIVISSDRGMVGSYNSNVIRGTNEFIEKHTPNTDDYMILAIGGSGADFYKKRGANVAYENRTVSDVPTYTEVQGIVKTITSMYNDGIYTDLYICYNHFINRISSDFRAEKLLPMDKDSIQSSMDEKDSGQAGSDVKVKNLIEDYDIEPSAKAVLGVVIPQYAESLMYGAILDAKTAEHASSSTAMKSATDNADDLISLLELKYNRARQAAITTEITEITGGQEALNQ